MDFDDISINSTPTMGPDGVRRSRINFDEASLGSAPTRGPSRDVSTKRPLQSLGQIDQYALVRKLGGGGFGVVYLARDTDSGVDVALKTLHPLLKADPEEMEALRAKFALVSRLTHQNIAKALVLHRVRNIAIADGEIRDELRLSPGDIVMMMDYAPGVTLSKWRKQFPDGVVPLDQAFEVARQIALALDYAHGEKIVHRDIKPANVMVETLPAEASQPSQVESRKSESRKSSGASSQAEPTLVTRHPSLVTPNPPPVTSRIRVRILDFGLAAEIRSSMSRVSNETGDTSGTRPYMAPEQWLGRKQDGRTDQYALACVLYELLSGAPPFSGVFETGDPAIMKSAVVGDPPEEIEGIPAHVNAALQRALAKDPKARFESCAAFVKSCLTRSSSNNLAQRTRKVLDAEETGRFSESGVGDSGLANPRFPITKPILPRRATTRPRGKRVWLWLLAVAIAMVGCIDILMIRSCAPVSGGDAPPHQIPPGKLSSTNRSPSPDDPDIHSLEALCETNRLAKEEADAAKFRIDLLISQDESLKLAHAQLTNELGQTESMESWEKNYLALLESIQKDPEKVSSLPEHVLRAREITAAQNALQNAVRQRNALLTKYTDRHPEVEQLNNQIKVLKQQLQESIGRARDTAVANLDLLRKQVTSLREKEAENLHARTELGSKISDAQSKLSQLEQECQLANTNYITVAHRLYEARLEKAFAHITNRVIRSASPLPASAPQ